jgi:HEAT repeat protein
MPQVTNQEPLDAQTTTRLTDFARACKAAARAVSLYPPAHPAVGASLDRLVVAAARVVVGGPMTIAVLPNSLMVGNKAPERPDVAVVELASLLHDHLIGELQVVSAADAKAWQSFLHLLAQPAIEVQGQGGISRLWTGGGGDHVRVREVDYAEVLRQRTKGLTAQWDTIIRHCLQDDTVHIDEESLSALLEIADDAERLHELVERIERETADGGLRVQAEALARLFHFIADAVAKRHPEKLDQAYETMSRVAGKLSPEILLGILARQAEESATGPDVVKELVTHMSDDTVGEFVAQNVVDRRGATERLAQAFQTLVPEERRRPAVLGLARDQVVDTPFGAEEDFPKLWEQTTDLLLSYRDEPFVTEAYASELSGAREHAVDVERIADDPPEQVALWVASISDSSVRILDLQLLLDLLQVEQDAGQWDVVGGFVAAHVDELVLLGDFDSAEPLVSALAAEAGANGRHTHRAAAASALDRLLHGQLMTYLVGHLRTIDDAGFDRVRKLCVALGTAAIRPLAEALSIEDRGRAFRRLSDLLVAFGTAGREAVEQLKNSPNPAVRRTAIFLLREFGGSEALSELASLLDDAEPNIQREAIRAIALIGSTDAHAVLQRALAAGTPAQRETIVSALGSMRDERAVPLFCHMVRTHEYRRTMRRAYLTAVEGLGAVGGADAVQALADALHHGEWYAPFRTAALRRAAAGALRRTGSPEALSVLRDAAERGSRGVRAAALEQLTQFGPPEGAEAGRA